MKKILLAATFIGSCTALMADDTLSSSDEADVAAMQTSCCETSVHSRIQAGASYSYLDLKPSGYASTNGSLGGLYALYEYRPANRFYGALSFSWREGSLHGGNMKRHINEYDVQERLGYTLSSCDDSMRITLFSGFGYRYLGQNVNESGSSVQFNYSQIYIPVGFLSEVQFNDSYTVGLNFQWMPQVFSTVAIRPLAGSRWDLNEEAANFLVELPLTIDLIDCWSNLSVTFVPFVEWWKDGRTSASSTSGISLNVPSNSYVYGGAKLSLSYTF